MSATGDLESRGGAQAGTTLIEALAVVAITSLVALIGFPRLQQELLTLAQRQTVCVVAARLRQVRAEAMVGDRPMVFAIGRDGLDFRASDGASARTPPGVELNAARPGVTFYVDGSSSGGSIWVRAGRRSVPVFVAPVTGAVSVGRP